MNNLWVIFQFFSRQIWFSSTFQESPLYSSTFQACANPVWGHLGSPAYQGFFLRHGHLLFQFQVGRAHHGLFHWQVGQEVIILHDVAWVLPERAQVSLFTFHIDCSGYIARPKNRQSQDVTGTLMHFNTAYITGINSACCCHLILFKIIFFEKIFQEYHQCQFGSKSGPVFCWHDLGSNQLPRLSADDTWEVKINHIALSFGHSKSNMAETTLKPM